MKQQTQKEFVRHGKMLLAIIVSLVLLFGVAKVFPKSARHGAVKGVGQRLVLSNAGHRGELISPAGTAVNHSFNKNGFENNRSLSASAQSFAQRVQSPASGARLPSAYQPHAAIGPVPVLMYHYIGDLPPNADALRRGLTVSTKDFSDQMEYLDSHGYHAVTCHDLYEALQGNIKLPQHPVAITLDDGYQDAFDNAVPILVRHHMVGTFAVVSGFVGQRGYAGWDTIAKAMKDGMEIVSHSYAHYDFTQRSATDSEREYQVAKAQVDLTERLGITNGIFIYPYGHLNHQTEDVLRSHGYVMAFTTRSGVVDHPADLLSLPRVRVPGGEDLQHFIRSLE